MRGRQPGQGFGCQDRERLSLWGRLGGLARQEEGPELPHEAAGRLGGQRTLARYGREHYSRLSGQRWGDEEKGVGDYLTRRERDLVMLVAQGSTDRAIAQRLGIEQRTVKWELFCLNRRLGTNGRTALAVLAVQEHLIPPVIVPRAQSEPRRRYG